MGLVYKCSEFFEVKAFFFTRKKKNLKEIYMIFFLFLIPIILLWPLRFLSVLLLLQTAVHPTFIIYYEVLFTWSLTCLLWQECSTVSESESVFTLSPFRVLCLSCKIWDSDLFIGQRQSSERTHCAMCSAWGNYSVHCYGRPLEKGIQCVEHLAVR